MHVEREVLLFVEKIRPTELREGYIYLYIFLWVRSTESSKGVGGGVVLGGGEEGRAGVGSRYRSGAKAGLGKGVRRRREAREDRLKVVRSVPSSEKIVIAGDFNGHIGVLLGGYDDVHEGFGFGDRNGEGVLYWILRGPLGW